jgi:hypothetical protein
MGHALSSRNDDELGGCEAQSALARLAPPICRRRRRNASRRELIRRHNRRRIRRRRRLPANIAASGASHRHSERSEPSDQARRTAVTNRERPAKSG